ncbi:ROK family protein [Desertihabitans brevis]|uniref:ROK family protein n=1 Tax=Desertihabitans brevis TaxID=2268447 RepID=A0A367YXU5_9ACTN|nr:ROK family protein [Desertihabitans brevis]RCK70716.1 ROK family protein [Desertihabitans brevis]
MPADRRSGASPRELHRAQVVERLRHRGRTSRAELVEATGLSRDTVSGLVAELLADGEVVVAPGQPRTDAGGGRPPQHLTLNPAAGVLLGLDFGHRRVLMVLVDAAHEVVGWRRRTYPPGTSWPERCTVALTAVEELLAEDPAGRPLAGCGVGVPGGTVQRADVLATIRARVSAALDVPVRTDNNARLAGLAEATWGAARGIADVAYLRLSAGVGGALVLGGRIRTGSHDLGGELGHVCVDPAGPVCRCTKRGCLEAHVRLEQVLADTGCHSLPELRSRVAAGEEAVCAVVARAGRRVGGVLAAVGTALDLHHFVLAGELVVLGEALLEPVRDTLRAQLGLGASAQQDGQGTSAAQVVPAQLGDQAGALGAIALLLGDPGIDLTPAGTGV